MRRATRMLERGTRMMRGLVISVSIKGKVDERTYWLLMELEYRDQTNSSARAKTWRPAAAYLMLDELQVPELIDQERLVCRMEEGSGQHPLESPWDFIVVHQQSSK